MTRFGRAVTERLIDGLLRIRWWGLLAAVVLAGIAWPLAQRVGFERTLEALYAHDNPYLKDYRESKAVFGGNSLVIVAYRDPDLFVDGTTELSDRSAQRIRALASDLEKVPGVESVQHLADALHFRFRREKVLEFLSGLLVGPDRQTTALIVRLNSTDDVSTSRGATIAQIRDIAHEYVSQAAVVGEPILVHDMFRYVSEDGRLLFRVSLGLLSLVILILFRRIRWVVLPVAVVLAAILWTRAILAISGMELTIVSSMLNSLITIVGVATAIHVIVHYRDYGRTEPPKPALRRTGVELGPAILWTCVTTAVGFAALLASEVAPVRSFGIMMAVGALLILPAAALVLPGGMLVGRSPPKLKAAVAEARLVGVLTRAMNWSLGHPWWIALSAAVLTALAAGGLWQLEVQTVVSRNFRASSPIVQSLDFAENHLGGAGTWEVNFPAPAELDQEYLARVRDVTQRLRGLTEDSDSNLTKVVSLTDGLALVPKLPFLTDTLEERLNLLNGFQPDFTAMLYNPEARRMRILLRAYEQQPSEAKLQLISQVEQTARQVFPEAEATGLFVLLAHLVESLLHDQLVTFGLAAAGIVLVMTIAFRSLLIGLISLVPNLFPIVLVVGAMGWIRLPVNLATAMIACVSMGLTVDGTIHYIAGYRRARREGRSVPDALRTIQQGVGLALVFSVLALVAGFLVLTLSHFIPLIHFGVLVSVALLGGLVADLLLLPVLLRLIESRMPRSVDRESTAAMQTASQRQATI